MQALLNLMRRKGLFTHSTEVVFLTEHNIVDFMDTLTNGPGVTLYELLKETLLSSELNRLIAERIALFDNSSAWATEQHKILSTKEPTETPLNVRKKGNRK